MARHREDPRRYSWFLYLFRLTFSAFSVNLQGVLGMGAIAGFTHLLTRTCAPNPDRAIC